MRIDWFSDNQFRELEDCGFEKEYSKFRGQKLDEESFNRWRVEHVFEDGSKIEAINNCDRDGSSMTFTLEFYNNRPIAEKRINFDSFDKMIVYIRSC